MVLSTIEGGVAANLSLAYNQEIDDRGLESCRIDCKSILTARNSTPPLKSMSSGSTMAIELKGLYYSFELVLNS